MDLALIETEPHTRDAIIALVLLGLIGYGIVRQWPRSLAVWVILAVALSIILTLRFVALLYEDMPREYVRFLTGEIALGVGASLIGIGFPILASRQSRSRPAP